VESIEGGFGVCAYPVSDSVTVAANREGSTVVQEIGHLADLWAYSDDPDIVMTNVGGRTSDQLTCAYSSSRFVTIITPCRLFDSRFINCCF